MKDNNIIEMLAGCDSGVNPSAEITSDTLTKMNEFSRKTPLHERVLDHPKVKKSGKLTLILAATLACVALLMGAGFRVFEHIFFMAGEGIVANDLRDGLVMEYATKMGTHYIEAASLLKNEEGNFELTLITDVEARYREDRRTLTLELSDGTRMTSESSMNFKFKNVPEQTSYKIYDDEGGSATIELIPIDTYEYAVYKYPVDHGITLVMFPLSKGSQMLAYTTAFDPSEEPQNIIDLANKSEAVSATLAFGISNNAVFTDVNGKTYKIIQASSSRQGGQVNESGFLNGQYLVRLNERPDAELAKIEIKNLWLNFDTNQLMSPQIIEIPALDETVPITTPFIDRFGIFEQPESITFMHTPDMKHNDKETWSAEIVFGNISPMDGVEYVSNVTVDYKFKNVENGYLLDGQIMQKFIEPGSPEFEWHKHYISYYAYEDDLVVEPGDLVEITASGVSLTVSGDWVIDFTDKVEKPAPTETTAEAEPAA